MSQSKHEIHERIYKFILQVLLFIKRIPRTYENQILVGQLTRSITSMGANDQEADGAFTRPDFIHCYTLVRKEAKESLYWIRLIGDCNSSHQAVSNILTKEVDEIIRIVTSIILNTRNKK